MENVQWEYHRVGDPSDAKLAKLGEEHWELVSTDSVLFGAVTIYVFKRPIAQKGPTSHEVGE